MTSIQPDATKLESRIRQNIGRLPITAPAPAVTQEQGVADLEGETVQFAPDICGDISSPRPIIGPLVVAVRRILRFLLWPFLGRQIIVNQTIARILESQTASNRKLGISLANIDRELVVLRNRMVGLRRELYQSADSNAKLSNELSKLREESVDADAKLCDELSKLREESVDADAKLCDELSKLREEYVDSNAKLRDELSKLQGEISVWRPREASEIDRPSGAEIPFVDAAFQPESGESWYPRSALGPWTIASRATRFETIRKVMAIARCLVRDDIIDSLLCFYEHGVARFGADWRFADIATTLVALGELVKPARYLEIGVFHGRSISMIAATSPQCELFGFDMWIPDYAGLANPGPDLVLEQLRRVGHTGPVRLISGDSHETVPRFLAEHPDLYFDVITVDGDHTARGAAQDLKDVMPRLKLGGFLVFDDIMHPETRYLWRVWSQVVATDPGFVTWDFREMGNGVALAMKICP
jgi:predicted O-methyltransferase YrrM